jgi:signal transduction histidine kinase
MSDWKAVLLSCATVAVMVLAVTGSGAGTRLELPLRDVLMRARPAAPARVVAVVTIDDESIAELGRWPWSRTMLAGIVDRARAEGAIAVALDILLVDPTPEDAALGRTLDESDALLLVGFEPESATLLPPATLSGASELVHGVLELDGDGVLRRLASTKQTGTASYAAMSAAIAARVEPRRSVPVGREIVPLFSVRPDDIPRVRASELLSGGAGENLAGRIVLVGVSATGLGDRVVTPVTKKGRLDPGVLVHAAVAEAIVRGDLVSAFPPWLAALAAALVTLAAWGAARLDGPAHVLGEISVISLPLVVGVPVFLFLKLSSPMVLLMIVAVASVLLLESRTLLAVGRGVGRAARVLGEGSEGPLSPADRVRRLEALAGEIAEERRETLESHRVVAHELRTPLTSIRGLAKLLSAYELSEDERRRVAGMVAEESTRLHEMVESLLDLERLALRDPAASRAAVDIRVLLTRRAELARSAGGHRIDLELEEGIVIEGAPELLERMIENLVGNAMKFSPPDTTVTLRGLRRGEDVMIEVDDEGPGVPADERPLVFRRFGRGRGADGHEGLGLGLAFVAEIARWHGGQVEVDEGRRGGACFRVTLPAAGEAEEAVG